MAILRRRKEEEDIEEKEVRTKKVGRVDKKDKKIKKEQPKVWGRKERLIVLFFILVTAGASSVLALSSRAWKLPGIPRIKLRPFSFPFFGEERIVIEGDNFRDIDQGKVDEVIDEFKEVTKDLSGVYGLYVVDLKTGFSYGVNEEEAFEPASLNKLPAMLALYREAEKRRLDLDSEYLLKESDKRSGSGSLSGKPEGFELTYRDLVYYMAKESDNTAFNIVINILGAEKVIQTMGEIGMENTVVFGEEQTTTPIDTGILFRKIWTKELINDEHSDELLDYLTDTLFEEWLVAGISKDIKVAHKYGREVHVVNDAGIVFSEDPFIVVILSEGVIEREADRIIPQLAQIISGAYIKN